MIYQWSIGRKCFFSSNNAELEISWEKKIIVNALES
jgi:hypothetical protein